MGPLWRLYVNLGTSGNFPSGQKPREPAALMDSGNMGIGGKTGLKGPRNKYIMSAKFRADEDRITACLEPQTKIGRWPYDPLNFELVGK